MSAKFQWVPDGQSNPGYGAASGNQTTPGALTVLAVNDNDRNGQFVGGFLRLLDSGSKVWAQNTANVDSWIKYNVTGPASHQSGGFTYIPVTVSSQGTVAAEGWTDIEVGFAL